MDAIELLEADHEKVSGLFEIVRQSKDSSDKREIFSEIREELEMHTFIEETIFYPACSQIDEMKDYLDDFYEEHAAVKDLLKEISSCEDDEDMETLLEELMENVENHVEKEENEFFPQIAKAMDQIKLEALGVKMEQAKQQQSRAA